MQNMVFVLIHSIDVTIYYVVSSVLCCDLFQQNAFPARFKGVYILNQPWYINFLLAIIRRFLSEKMNQRVSDYASTDSIHLSMILS